MASDFYKSKKNTAVLYIAVTAFIAVLAATAIIMTASNNIGIGKKAETTGGADITGVSSGPADSGTAAQTSGASSAESESETAAETQPGATAPPESRTEETAYDGLVSPLVDRQKKIDDDYSGTVLTATEDKGEDYLRRITFLGDSTTYGLKRYGVLPDGKATKQVWTPKTGTLTLAYASFATILYPEDDSEITIKEAAGRAKPDIMIITLGVNGISFMDEEYFKNEYTKLVNQILEASPDTKIILQSIFPVAATYEKLKSINNDKIVAANEWIASVASDTGVKFLNTASALFGPDGFLPEKWHNGDGLHLNEISFAIELSYIRTHAYPEDTGSDTGAG